jgi:hypothetical protein
MQYKGEDIVSGADKLLNKIGFKGLPELHARILGGKKYSYLGPGTNLDERLDKSENPKDWAKPINKIDEIAMHHDINYDKKEITRQEADKIMLDELNALKYKDLDWNEKLAKFFT